MNRHSFARALTLALILCLLCVFACAQTGDVYDRAGDEGRMSVRFIALDTTNGESSGDCTLLVSPEGKTMLLDAGEPTAAPMVIEALTRLGITHIDYLVASHPHIDHVGGMTAVLQKCTVGQVLTSFVDYPTSTNQGFLGRVKALGLPYARLKAGDSFAFGEQVRVDVLWPGDEIIYPDSFPDGSTQFVNNLSLVLRFSYGDSSFLFAGDLYMLGEKDAVKAAGAALDADVIKVNHHGNDTSSSKSWRAAVSAKYAVVENNGVGSLTVCQKFVREGTELYHTFTDGTVLIRTAGDGLYDVICEKQRKSDF